MERSLKVGIFTCPQCGEDINTDDKSSSHQVNDLMGDTFCSCECSVNYTVKNAQEIIVNKYGTQPLSGSVIEELISDFSVEGVLDEDLKTITASLKKQ